jgi:hypothetical protein
VDRFRREVEHLAELGVGGRKPRWVDSDRPPERGQERPVGITESHEQSFALLVRGLHRLGRAQRLEPQFRAADGDDVAGPQAPALRDALRRDERPIRRESAVVNEPRAGDVVQLRVQPGDPRVVREHQVHLGASPDRDRRVSGGDDAAHVQAVAVAIRQACSRPKCSWVTHDP